MTPSRPLTFDQAGRIATDLLQRNLSLRAVEVVLTEEHPADGQPVTSVFRWEADDLGKLIDGHIDRALAGLADKLTYSHPAD